jgi:ribonuclease Z
MQLTISGYSTALFSTWYFIEELGLLFDAGDGLISQLLQKSRKIKSVFISHADRDHLTGLLQLNQLNARPGYPKIYYPKDSRSINAFETFSKNFDFRVRMTEWIPIEAGQEIEIKKDVLVTSIKNSHVIAPNSIAKSFGYLVQMRKYKLKPEYLHLNQKEIIQLKQTSGDYEIVYEVRENMLGYSGDTPVENFHIWDNTKILIHEATFLNTNDFTKDDPRNNKHSMLEDVIKAASGINIQVLILGHFSSRYSNEEIDNCIRECCKKSNVRFKIFRILPGKYLHNIVAAAPVNC